MEIAVFAQGDSISEQMKDGNNCLRSSSIGIAWYRPNARYTMMAWNTPLIVCRLMPA